MLFLGDSQPTKMKVVFLVDINCNANLIRKYFGIKRKIDRDKPIFTV